MRPFPLLSGSKAAECRTTSPFFVKQEPYKRRAFEGPSLHKNAALSAAHLLLCIERRDGDSNPRIPGWGLTVFETAAFDHSAISPEAFAELDCKYTKKLNLPMPLPPLYLYPDTDDRKHRRQARNTCLPGRAPKSSYNSSRAATLFPKTA